MTQETESGVWVCCKREVLLLEDVDEEGRKRERFVLRRREGESGMERTRRQDRVSTRVETSTHPVRRLTRYTLRGRKYLHGCVLCQHNWALLLVPPLPGSDISGIDNTTPCARPLPYAITRKLASYALAVFIMEERRDITRTEVPRPLAPGGRSRSSITNL
jgi:hypothetical protein